MKVLFLDIDGVVVKANIQDYVSQIELFGDDVIKDFEYIKKCIQFMKDEALKNSSSEEIEFIQKVYQFVSSNMFEMLKEYRDCFLEFDNLKGFDEKYQYMLDYQKNPVIDLKENEVSDYMNYIIKALTYSLKLIENEYIRVNREGGPLKLPFQTINIDNDIIQYTASEDPLKRANSALKRMEIYAMNRESGSDDFLTACRMGWDNQIVDYDKIYVKERLVDGVVPGLKHLLESGKVDMIVACSHYTGYREEIAKKRLFEEELPYVIMVPESLLKFHTTKACMGLRRERSSKDMQISSILEKLSKTHNIDINNIESILLDDSLPNLESLHNKMGILYREPSKVEIDTNSIPEIDGNYVRQSSWNLDELDRVFNPNVKTKKII